MGNGWQHLIPLGRFVRARHFSWSRVVSPGYGHVSTRRTYPHWLQHDDPAGFGTHRRGNLRFGALFISVRRHGRRGLPPQRVGGPFFPGSQRRDPRIGWTIDRGHNQARGRADERDALPADLVGGYDFRDWILVSLIANGQLGALRRPSRGI